MNLAILALRVNMQENIGQSICLLHHQVIKNC
jgi:hypothetical protein